MSKRRSHGSSKGRPREPHRSPLRSEADSAVGAPKGLDAAIFKRRHDAFKFAMEQPEFRQVLARYEMEPAYLSSVAFQAFTVQSMRQEKDILDALGLSKT